MMYLIVPAYLCKLCIPSTMDNICADLNFSFDPCTPVEHHSRWVTSGLDCFELAVLKFKVQMTSLIFFKVFLSINEHVAFMLNHCNYECMK